MDGSENEDIFMLCIGYGLLFVSAGTTKLWLTGWEIVGNLFACALFYLMVATAIENREITAKKNDVMQTVDAL